MTAAVEEAGAPPKARRVSAPRIEVIDLWRGLVIVLMVLDHVRDYFHESGWAVNPLDFNQTDWVLYLTRWVTHLCAPSFVFLAGVAAYLQLAQGKALAKLSPFLLTRGLWLVVLELTLVGFGWSFSLPYVFLLQVIWAIGWAMVALAGLVWLGPRANLIIGAAIILLHNLLDPLAPQNVGALGGLWPFLHEGGPLAIGDMPIGFIAYPILPWIGIMALGYGLGSVFLKPEKERDRILLTLGLVLLVVFLALRASEFYGDPLDWAQQSTLSRTLMDFFDIQKYPPSLLYVCATLGLMFVLTPLLARLRGPVAEFFRTYGAVPLFAYLLHIYILHMLAIAWAALNGRPWQLYIGFFENIFGSAGPAALEPLGNPLWIAYAAWALTLAILYPLCRWYAHEKRARKAAWMSYL